MPAAKTSRKRSTRKMPARARGRAATRVRRRKLTASETRAWRSARQAGAEAASEAIARRERRLAAVRVVAAAAPGVLVAEGDSWFDYPLSDVLEELEDRHRWEVVSVAHKGDRVEDMAYADGQFSKLERALRKLADDDVTPKAILLSGGGNDIAGEEFAMLLNHKRSRLSPLNAQVVAGVFGERLRAAIVSLASGVTTLCRTLFNTRVPILIHGYDRPVPDGRGFLGGLLILPGPWLEPGFRRKGYEDLAETTGLMAALIDRFNDELAQIAGGPGLEHVQYVDLRGTLSNQLPGKAYKKSWANELHPTREGFQAVAERMNAALTALP